MQLRFDDWTRKKENGFLGVKGGIANRGGQDCKGGHQRCRQTI